MALPIDLTFDVELVKGNARLRYQIDTQADCWVVTIAVMAPVEHTSREVVITSDGILERYGSLHREIDILLQNGWSAETTRNRILRRARPGS